MADMTLARGAKWLAIAALLLAAWLGREAFDPQVLGTWVEQAGAAGPFLFVLVYAVGTVLVLPGLLLTLAGGVLFGPWWGTLYNMLGATLGAWLAFWLARHLAADWVERKMGGRLAQLKQGVEAEGWKFVAFTRLVPLFPFNLLNYALGLTRISSRAYVVTTLVCIAPASFAYTWLGHAGRAAFGEGDTLLQTLVIAVALIGLLAFLPGLVARMRSGPMLSVEQLKQKLDAEEELLLVDVRSAEERVGELGHLPHAQHMVLDDLAQRIDEISDWMEKPVLLLCRTDVRSGKAARLLAKQGFADVHVVRGGMAAWNAAGYPVVR